MNDEFAIHTTEMEIYNFYVSDVLEGDLNKAPIVFEKQSQNGPSIEI